ncbi:MAG: ABC transporter substrate-binding protein [Holosporaceae bacterium]|jgi:trehalose/maltose transport system substrate-binding protein|nr:ABC transporter substrate-binding protein [Holosporaceae bacterium]
MLKRLFFFVAAISLFSASFDQLQAATIRIAYRSKGREMELLRKAIDEWLKKYNGEHAVEIVTLPHASNECYALYQQWFGAGSFDVDILQADIAWMSALSNYWEPLDEYCKDISFSDYFDVILENMKDDKGGIIALPVYVDCGVMYYRKDLLEKYGKEVPKTLEDLYETALYIQNEERKDEAKKNRFYGLVYQAKAFEILTCNFCELIDACGGAVVKDGKVEINSPRGMYAAEFFVKCIKNIMSHSVLNYSEEDARGMFQSGNAVFMRSWPYAYALMNDPSTAVSGKVGVMTIPPSATGGKESGILGGWLVAVSKYSKHKALAADLAKFIASKEQQKHRVEFSYLPTFKSLYSDPDVLKTKPFIVSLREPLLKAVARPTKVFGKNYSKASSEIFNTINTILADSLEDNTENFKPNRLMNRLNTKLENLLLSSGTADRLPASDRDKAGEVGVFANILNSISAFFSRCVEFFRTSNEVSKSAEDKKAAES